MFNTDDTDAELIELFVNFNEPRLTVDVDFPITMVPLLTAKFNEPVSVGNKLNGLMVDVESIAEALIPAVNVCKAVAVLAVDFVIKVPNASA